MGMIHLGASVAGLIEEHLRSTGKSQVALERETGITDTHLARIRAGALPGKWVTPALAAALGLPADELAAMVAAEREARRAGSVGMHRADPCDQHTTTGAA